MKRKLLIIGAVAVLSLSMIAGCGKASDNTTGSNSNVSEPAGETNTTQAEGTHTHDYAEEITTAATCEAEGVKTFTCECGDSYTEAIPATGHSFNYVYNEDATLEADGTETGTCAVCGATDTRTASGTKLTYTFTDDDAKKYAKSSVNVRDLPSTDGNRLGSLSKAQEVHVTGKCNETGWYRIEYNGGVGYVSGNYIVAEKPVEQVATQNTTTESSNSNWTKFEYGINLPFYLADADEVWFFYIEELWTDTEYKAYNAACTLLDQNTAKTGKLMTEYGVVGTYQEGIVRLCKVYRLN